MRYNVDNGHIQNIHYNILLYKRKTAWKTIKKQSTDKKKTIIYK